MVRKVKPFLVIVCALALCCSLGATAHAATFTTYDGNPSNTYITYFKDIIPGIGLGDHYVAFRSSEYQYILAVGDISYNGGTFSSVDSCTIYTIQSTTGYGGYYSYTVGEIDSFFLTPGNKIVYSDVGNFPQLEERGAKYEILTTILIVACCVGFVCRTIFYSSKRR